MTARRIQVLIGVAAYLGAASIAWSWSDPPKLVVWVLLIAPSFLLGFLTASWCALVGPALAALFFLVAFDDPLESTGWTWGDAFALALAAPSAALVAFGVSWRRFREGRG